MKNNRILIIDDEEIVRDSISEILTGQTTSSETKALNEASLDLFDDINELVEQPKHSTRPKFEIQEAGNGEQGFEMVKKSLANNEPFAVIFLDMRMPGWDGLETCVQIRKVDPKVQVFFVTAFSDHSIDDIIKEAGGDVGYLSKPFNHEEILQIASKGLYDWMRITSLEKLLSIIGEIGFGTTQLNTLLINILHQVSDYLNANYALLGELRSNGELEEIATTGVGELTTELIDSIKNKNILENGKIQYLNGVVVCPMQNYFILAIPNTYEPFNQEKVYLLHLFVENAVRAIKNSQLNERLLEKEKLSAVGQAMSMLMHDIRNPISQIEGIIELIMSDPGNENENAELAHLIKGATATAMDIIQDVLDFVRNAKNEKNEIDLNEFLEKIIENQKSISAFPPCSFILNVKGNLKPQLDQKKFQRVIVNLMNNAREAMGDNKINNPEIVISAFKNSDKLCLHIQDNGPGIPEDIQSNLFEPFVTKDKSDGTGLGLAIVKQIIESHNGSIGIKPTEKGACFEIIIPYE